MTPVLINKHHTEFFPVDLTAGWETLPGYPEGIQQKILSGRLDEETSEGMRTRLLRFEPGAFTTEPFIHKYWEEVYVVTGDLIVGASAYGRGGAVFMAHAYACRPPGVAHGPFRSEDGCLLLEMHFFASV